MKIFQTVLTLSIVCVFSGCNSDKIYHLPNPFKVIPQPQKIEVFNGKGLKYGELTAIMLSGCQKRPVMGDILSLIPEKNKGTNKSILTLVLDSLDPVVQNPEGYLLTITDGNVKIESAGQSGLFYGCQTLEQLLEDSRDFNTEIPSCKITDYPALEYRAVHFDVKHHLDHMNYYYESIDRLARYKINAIIFEVEDKLRYVKRPLVGAPQAISINEMTALTDYAADRHIEISPLVQGLGHATFILKNPEYEYLREIPDRRWVSCSVEEGVYELYADLFRDAFKATPGSRYVHIGGDEIGDIGLCPRCKGMAEEIGEEGLYLYWLNKICDIANANGRIPIFWDDMPLKMAGVYESTWNVEYSQDQSAKDWEIGEPKLDQLIKGFPDNCVYMRWNYELGKLPGNIKTLDWYRKNNMQFMVSTAAQTGGHLFPKDDRTGSMSDGGPAAIRSFLQLAIEKNADGMLSTAWDDHSLHFETYWRGFIASAEYSWSSKGISLEDFDLAFLQKEFNIVEPNYYQLYKKLTEASNFWGMAFMRIGDRSDIRNALINLPGLAHWIPEAEKDKQQEKTDFTDIVIELPRLETPGTWIKKYEDRLEEAAIILENYNSTSEKIDELYTRSQINRYHWEIFKALNDFQVSAPVLLLAIKQCDTADENQRNLGKENIKGALATFNESWENLKTVYSKTRFISYPDNYVPDRYFHFASQREDLSWMIQAEELFHEMINAWMKEF